MQSPHYWKIGGAAALLGIIVTVLVPRERAATVRQVAAGQAARETAVEGRIEVIQPNRFRLRDATGVIRLETCPPWYRWLPLRPGERVRAVGELAPRSRWRRDEPVFVVYRLRRENGAEIALRFSRGTPPWEKETWRSTVELRVDR
jgi:hypothetical protein